MFKTNPKGTISKRKIKRVYPYVSHPDLPDTILELVWTFLNALVPLVVTPYFPRALGILWEALREIEALKNNKPGDVDYEHEVREMLGILNEEGSPFAKK
jgi:hypothetical protein